MQFTGSGQPCERNNDTDSDYDDDDNDDSEYNDNSNSDGDTDNDDGADTLCALCDDGGNLLRYMNFCTLLSRSEFFLCFFIDDV